MRIEKIIALSNLIKRAITSEITEDESRELELWRNYSEKNQSIYEKMTNSSLLAKVDRVKDYVDSKIALEKLLLVIQRRKNRQRRIRIASIAAAVFCPIAITLSFLYLNAPQSAKLEKVESRVAIAKNGDKEIVKSGSKQAILYLANGKTINLDDTSRIINVNKEKMFADNEIAIKELNHAAPVKYNTLKIPRGGEFNMILSDGTKVWLNSDSEITFPSQFTGNERSVKVRGEVFFDVAKAKNGKQKFIVETLTSKIEVLGTAFNVRCYPDEYSAVTLVRGEVKVTSDNREVTLSPGEQCLIEGTKMNVLQVDTEEYVAWIDGIISFKDKTLEFIMQNLSRWYNVNVDFEQDELKDIVFTGTFQRYDDFNIIVEMFENTGGVKFLIKEKHIVISKK